MPEDKFGIPYWYATKTTAGLTGEGVGFFWEQGKDIFDDSDAGMVRLGKEHDHVDVIEESTGTWMFPFTFAYDYSPSLSLSGPTGHHSGGETHGCQGYTYMIHGEDFDSANPSFRFRKETYHVQYDNDPQTGLWTHPSATGTVSGNWKGFGWVRYNRKDGRGPGKDSVICEAWWNNDPENHLKDGWVMLKRTEDKGVDVSNWGVKATCDGDDYQVGTWSNIQFRFKSSGADFSLHPLKPETDDGPNINSIGGEKMSFHDCEARGYGYRNDMPRDIEMKCLFKWNAGGQGKCYFKNISIREIDPTKDFDDDQNTPPPDQQPTETTELKGFLKLLSDINNVETSACAGTSGGGGSGGTSKFYSITVDSDKELSDSSTFSNRKRLAELVVNSSSIIKGKIVLQLDVPLKKVGSPGASPVISAKIWHGTSVVYTSPTTIDPSTLTTSFVYKTFDFSTNTHTMVAGDYIGVEYTGTSSSNYVVGSYASDTIANSEESQFEGSSWDDKSSREFACDMWN